MQLKVLVITALLFCSLFLFTSCGEIKSEWHATAEQVDGVMTVTNPIEPYYGEVSFELEEDLSIGNEEDENYLFYSAFDLAVDQDGNIYISENRNIRVQKFDRVGNYLQTIGRKGQGPGEYEQPSHLFYDESKGNICVQDGREIVIFDGNGNYLNDVFFLILPYDYMLSNDGNIWGRFAKTGEKYASTSISMVNPQGEFIKDIAETPMINSSYTIENGIMMFTHGYEYGLVFSDIDSQTFIYGNSQDYKLHVVRSDGELLLIIEKDEPQMPFTNALINRIFDARYKGLSSSQKAGFKFPDTFPFFNLVFTDDTGRIYVKRTQLPDEEENLMECDIFSKDGYYLYKISIPMYETEYGRSSWIVKNGYYYTIKVDEETGLETVKRYTIKNWDQIKTGIN